MKTGMKSNLLSSRCSLVVATFLVAIVAFRNIAVLLALLKFDYVEIADAVSNTFTISSNSIIANRTVSTGASISAINHVVLIENASTVRDNSIVTTSVNSVAPTRPTPIFANLSLAELLKKNKIINVALGRDQHKTRRAQLQLAPVDNKFLSDLSLVKKQLSHNYDRNSSCRHLSLKTFTKRCFGLGTTMGKVNEVVMRNNGWGVKFSEVDEFTCPWFERDKSKSCNTMFGDCYFPALTWGRGGNANGTCLDTLWFKERYGAKAFFAGHFSWLLSDVVAETEPCIALHIRRGDACINNDRTCFDFDEYWRATKFFVDQYPELQRIVVVTDGDDFPLEKFQSLVKEVTYTSEVNRSKYNVNHLRNESIEAWSPEFRDLENATSELIAEVSEASRCTAFVGTFSAGVSRWIFLNMLTRQGRVPLFYSLEGCISNAFGVSAYAEKGCEPRFL